MVTGITVVTQLWCSLVMVCLGKSVPSLSELTWVPSSTDGGMREIIGPKIVMGRDASRRVLVQFQPCHK